MNANEKKDLQEQIESKVISLAGKICKNSDCQFAGQEQSIDNFYKGRGDNYLNPTCKKCISNKVKNKWKTDNEFKENKISYYKKWRVENKEHVKEEAKNWRAKNLNHVRQYYQGYYERNKDIIANRRKNHKTSYSSTRIVEGKKIAVISKTLFILPLQLEIMQFLSQFMNKSVNQNIRKAIDNMIETEPLDNE